MRGRPVDGDRRLLDRVAAGDRDALAELYERFGRELFRYVLTLVPDARTAEEVLQDTLVAAWRGAHTFRGRSTARTWLFGVARRQALGRMRRKELERVAEEELGELPAPEPGPEEALLAHVRREALEDSIRQLAPLHREVLALVFYHGLSYEETARLLDVPVGTVKSRLSNAKKALRKLLKTSEEAT